MHSISIRPRRSRNSCDGSLMLRSRARRLNQEKWRRWRCTGLDIDPQALDPAVRTALTRALESTNGTPRFVELVQRFQLQDRAPELVVMALADPEGNLGKEAARLAINLVYPHRPAVAAAGEAPRVLRDSLPLLRPRAPREAAAL